MIRIDSSPRSTSAREVTIFGDVQPGAALAGHSRRNAALVTPAMGASTTGVSTVSRPIRRRRKQPVHHRVTIITPPFSPTPPRSPRKRPRRPSVP